MPCLTISLLVLAGMFKAVADTLADHFDVSIFKHLNRKFWDKSVSWQYANYLPFTGYHLDAWHIANSLQLVCWCAIAAVTHSYIRYPWWATFIGAAILFTLSFNLFYNKILRI